MMSVLLSLFVSPEHRPVAHRAFSRKYRRITPVSDGCRIEATPIPSGLLHECRLIDAA